MTIRELIAALEAMANDCGDLPVYAHDDWAAFLVQGVKYEPKEETATEWSPEYVLIVTGDDADTDTVPIVPKPRP